MGTEPDWPDRLAKAGRQLAAARAKEAKARREARDLALAAIKAGETEAGVAKALGVDRMAVRNWLGKRDTAPKSGVTDDVPAERRTSHQAH